MKKFLKQAISIIVSAAMLATPAMAAETAEEVDEVMAAEIYVAPWGDDNNAGTIDAPLRTIGAAKDAARAVNDKARDVTVVLRGGEYILDDTLVFSAEDGGQNGHSVSWRGYDGEKAVISGMTEISGWQLHDESKNIYKAAVPEGFNTRQLYVDGQKARRSRSTLYGDNPYYNLDRTCELGIPARNNREFYFYKDEVADWNNFEGVEVHLLTAWTENILRLKKYDDNNSFKYVTVDNGGSEGVVEAAAVKFQEPESDRLFNRPHPDITGSTLGYKSRSYYYFENAYEFIDEDNEWYLDTTENTLYFKAPANADMNAVRVTAPGLETLVEIAGTKEAKVENLSFENLSFEGSAWLRPSEEGLVGGQACQYVLTSNLKNEITVYHPAGAFLAQYADNLSVDSCSFSKIGSTAIDFFCGVTNSRIYSCEVFDVAGNGISVAKFTQDENTEFHVAYNPADKSEICSGIRMINNSVHDIGTEYEGAVAIAAGYPEGIIIAHNEIFNCPYSGISVGFGWTSADNAMKRNIIYANKLHEVGLVTCDYGAIYTLSKQPQSLCTRNYIYNAQRMPWFDYGYAAMYFDEQTEGYVIKENLLHNIGSDAWGGGINFNGCANKNTTTDNWNIKGEITDSAAKEVADSSGIADKTFEEIVREALELLDDIINPKEPVDESDYYIQKRITPVAASATAADGGSSAEYAIDGKGDTVFTLSGQTAGSIADQYLLIELSGEEELARIEIDRQYNAGGMTGDNSYWADWCLAVGCELQGSMDGEAWETIGVMNTWPDNTGDISKEVFNIAKPKPYKFVRYIRTKFKTGSDYAVWRWSSSDGGNRLNVKEIHFYANVPGNKIEPTAVSATACDPGSDPAWASDGDMSTVYTLSGQTAASMAEQYLLLELNGEQPLEKVIIRRQYNAGGMLSDNSYWADWCLAVGCELQGSMDGEAWETIGVMNTWPDNTGDISKEVFNIAEPKPYKFVRYIRTKFKTGSDYAVWRWSGSDGGNRLNVKEIELYSSQTEPEKRVTDIISLSAENGIAAAEVYNGEDGDAMLYLAAYDGEGKLVSVDIVTVGPGEGRFTFTAANGAAKLKAMLWLGSCIEPLCISKSLDLN